MTYKPFPAICKFCEKGFTSKRGGKRAQKFCSRKCASQGMHKPKEKPNARKPRMTRSCPICNAQFSFLPSISMMKRGGKQFCSRKCKGIASRQPKKKCEVCNRVFQPTFSSSKRFCSSGCKHESRRNGKNVQCEQCGNTFYLPRIRLDNAKNYFCSAACANKWQGRNKVELTCDFCGVSFRRSLSLTGKYKKTYCSSKCRYADPENKKRLLEMNANQQKNCPNKLELAGYALLKNAGIDFEPQALIANKFYVDAFVSSHNLIIQFDGDYWHCHPDKYPSPGDRQLRQVKRDKSQNAYLTKCGYTVLRFWGTDIRKKPKQFIAQVETMLRQSPPLPIQT